ncbi:MAG: hypothetical protein AAB875_02565 [Patescibacteria group bacterium]
MAYTFPSKNTSTYTYTSRSKYFVPAKFDSAIFDHSKFDGTDLTFEDYTYPSKSAAPTITYPTKN